MMSKPKKKLKTGGGVRREYIDHVEFRNDRIALGVTMKEAAEITAVPYRTWQHWEMGTRVIPTYADCCLQAIKIELLASVLPDWLAIQLGYEIKEDYKAQFESKSKYITNEEFLKLCKLDLSGAAYHLKKNCKFSHAKVSEILCELGLASRHLVRSSIDRLVEMEEMAQVS
jgi:DNA-binding transcriptional regulator YiaG